MIINSVVDGMSEALYAAFGSDYKIYTEAVRQKMTAPCFFIGCGSTQEEEKLIDRNSAGRYERTNNMQVFYFPADDETHKAEYNDVVDKLYDALEYIYVDGDLTRGTDKSSEMSDGILQFNVTYRFELKRGKEDSPLMELLTIEQGGLNNGS